MLSALTFAHDQKMSMAVLMEELLGKRRNDYYDQNDFFK